MKGRNERVALGAISTNVERTLEERKVHRRERAKDKHRKEGKLSPQPPECHHALLLPQSYATPPPASQHRRGVSVGSASSAGSAMEVTPAPPSPSSPDEPVRQSHGSKLTPFVVPALTFSPRSGEIREPHPAPHKTVKVHRVPAAPSHPYLLPPQAAAGHAGKLTVVFDLDETLVSNRRPGVVPATPRHYLFHMFQLLKGMAEIVLWTASTPVTGQPVVQQIDPKGEFFHHVIYRNDRWFTEGSHTKDLKLLGRDMSKVVIVENTPNCCKFNPNNAILVEDFVGDLSKPDRTLLSLAQVIRGAIESATKKISIPRFLKYYSRTPGSAIEVYELGLPAAYQKLGEAEAMVRIKKLEPLMRPPLGLYYYVTKH